MAKQIPLATLVTKALKGKTQMELAGRCGCSQTHICNLVKGRIRSIKTAQLDRYANGLGVSRKALLRACLASSE